MSNQFEQDNNNAPLDFDEHFTAAVREGIEAAERGELYSHEFVRDHIEKLLTLSPRPAKSR